MARRPPNTELDALITQYQHESARPRADEALLMLRKIGSIVKPIMRRRSWRVGTLAEFYPSQTNLLGLNINAGQKINLRLRHAGDATQFLRFEDIVDTMLHELCHNVIGPHNEAFHALWDQLRDEHEALGRKGYTGEGFLGKGRHLGGQRLPIREAGRLARQAAELRRQRDQGFGHRLGGTGIVRGQDARVVIADAIERRLRIERGCASGTTEGEQAADDEATKGTDVATTQAGPQDQDEATMMQAFIDLIEEEEREKFGGYYSPPTAENPAGPRQTTKTDGSKAAQLKQQQRRIEQELRRPAAVKPQSKPFINPVTNSLVDLSDSSRTVTPSPPPATSLSRPIGSEIPLDTWTCEICTLVNPLDYLTCDACGVERPAAVALLYGHNTQVQSHDRTSKPPPQKKLKETPNALKPRSNAYDSIKRFEQERLQKVDRGPMAWKCGGCGNFMEAEWWTCARCGRMKDNS